jgi:fumarate hydratase class II
LADELRKQARRFADVARIGRTHLQDATPLSAGDEIGAWATQIEQAGRRIESGLQEIYPVAQGGTAVGTGLNAPEGFDDLVCEKLAKLTGLPFTASKDKFAALATHDALVGASGDLNRLAVALFKISADFKLLASGPRGGLGELVLPANEAGSSIMHGKVNPTQAEALAMVCCQVMGDHHAISMAGSQGQLQLNVFKPGIIVNLLGSVQLLGDACESFRVNCVVGLDLDRERPGGSIADADAGDGVGARDRLRQGRADRPHRPRGTNQLETGGPETGIRERRGIRPPGGSPRPAKSFCAEAIEVTEMPDAVDT